MLQKRGCAVLFTRLGVVEWDKRGLHTAHSPVSSSSLNSRSVQESGAKNFLCECTIASNSTQLSYINAQWKFIRSKLLSRFVPWLQGRWLLWYEIGIVRAYMKTYGHIRRFQLNETKYFLLWKWHWCECKFQHSSPRMHVQNISKTKISIIHSQLCSDIFFHAWNKTTLADDYIFQNKSYILFEEESLHFAKSIAVVGMIFITHWLTASSASKPNYRLSKRFLYLSLPLPRSLRLAPQSHAR